MLVLRRDVGQRIMVGDDIVITLTEICTMRAAKIGIEAPKNVSVHREEVIERIQREGTATRFISQRKE